MYSVGFGVCGQSGGDVGGHKLLNVTSVAGDLFHEMRAGVAVSFGRHDKDRFDRRVEVPIHQSHVEFKFEIGEGAQAADDGVSLLFDGKVHQQAGERGHGYVRVLDDVRFDQLYPFFG